MNLEYCSHGKRLMKTPHENCDECDELYDYTIALDCLKTLTRIFVKRRNKLTKGTPNEINQR